jgi:hypothetical protein
MNVLKEPLRTTIETLLRRGVGQRQIQRLTQIDRKTIRRYARGVGLSNRPTAPRHPQ